MVIRNVVGQIDQRNDASFLPASEPISANSTERGEFLQLPLVRTPPAPTVRGLLHLKGRKGLAFKSHKQGVYEAGVKKTPTEKPIFGYTMRIGEFMSQNEIEILKAGAPDLKRQQDEQERKIRSEVATEFPDLSPEGRESVVQSRLNILNNPGRPKLIQVDLGENASKKVKDKLFE